MGGVSAADEEGEIGLRDHRFKRLVEEEAEVAVGDDEEGRVAVHRYQLHEVVTPYVEFVEAEEDVAPVVAGAACVILLMEHEGVEKAEGEELGIAREVVRRRIDEVEFDEELEEAAIVDLLRTLTQQEVGVAQLMAELHGHALP